MKLNPNIIYHYSTNNTILIINLETSRLFRLNKTYFGILLSKKIELLPEKLKEEMMKEGIIIE